MGKIRTFVRLIKQKKSKEIIKIIYSKFAANKIDNFSELKKVVKNKSGIEIGGPSWIFRDYSIMPIYRLVHSLDGCNYSKNTLWEKNISEDKTYRFYKDKIGYQYITEATDLSMITNSKYDFLISSNCLEHIANPLKALEEWIRVVDDKGYILLVLPDKNFCFDHKREITTFKHLLDDYNNNTKEDDFTHLKEILLNHDLLMDIKAGTFEQFKERSLDNYKIRGLHHHVFNVDLLIEIYSHFNLDILFTEKGADNIIILGRKINN